MNLSKAFPSLATPLSTSQVIGLYFASSWCPDCTPITPKLRMMYEGQSSDKKLEVVYVSSDNTEEQMKNSLSASHGQWSCIPFDSAERSELKRKFGVCAGKEVRELGMSPSDRKFGIPTLILIDSKSEEILTYDGVNDLLNDDFIQKYSL
mmetsp:Transcript_19543/g.24633  ORF Transcript_19543/g.24633 Transcript_19543/m.24633 type:complete len:150 (-) Transcript_19543:55-504(-)|eukprot:CAMPEP_0203692092 /NCGR_PEP_ID=MMETSP0091-20130426/4318_1 /ASSEMBLY_ACC=CAM_ASM_001089 /TAXON_ID=426623 /ORGANISM="Chaetoceros affinis, Strain CCMP159" /LENGTH=149 /DNA_ID=CAMNT_0050562821 /DNA_START=84 /DNA_END=533 /DNA_ORIENTATION=-